jgi:hypothetical protein
MVQTQDPERGVFLGLNPSFDLGEAVKKLGQAPSRPLISKVFAVSARSQSHLFTASARGNLW